MIKTNDMEVLAVADAIISPQRYREVLDIIGARLHFGAD
jgi:hypothetical protein